MNCEIGLYVRGEVEMLAGIVEILDNIFYIYPKIGVHIKPFVKSGIGVFGCVAGKRFPIISY